MTDLTHYVPRYIRQASDMEYGSVVTHENYNDLDSRLMEFVEVLGAQDRILTEYNVDNIDQGKKIDYGTNLLLKELREKSWEFLDSAFVGEK